ncbi:uncharacterized protein LOC135485017 [Lineus longissimus]|uniref:uncharacterized protein LOC135485017 n=1 Tax=Lineus longissimus TaxID=88925 RepID=UPI002B4D15B5
MGVKKSEYGRSYVKSPQKYLAKEFEGKLDYRTFRRQMEARHTPFDWENGSNGFDEELDTIRSSLFDEELNPHPPQEPEHIKKFKLYKQMRETPKKVEESDQACKTPPNSLEVEDPEVITMPPLDVEETESEDESAPDSAHLYKNVDAVPKVGKDKSSKNKKNRAVKKKKEVREKKGEEVWAKEEAWEKKEKKTSKKTQTEKITRPVRPSKYRKIPRPVSAPTGRPARRCPPPPIDTEEKPPFVPFGAADKERTTGTLKTYNIRASADIYPSALQAQRRKEAEVKRRSERVKSAPIRERRKQALFNDIMDRATASWDTEYRRNYAAFEPSEYARNAAERTCGGERFYVPL